MKWQIPPHGEMYKLVATRKHKDDIGLIVLYNGQRREYSWKNVPNLKDKELKDYLLSMSEGITKGIYDVALLDEELGSLF
ncbi:hypothetical protein M3638_10275 [Oceanobacillus profundus]|uniref:hypothetical protein n=1 Tax=Oceanobacillus profundus TaxID=372463 RepID=UPI00203F83FE|nr:hypothetical protein [Oceanobacillus profundus]MCM3398209.1 hypothetical protein [Oceanobacillus profundus]